jgi:filamentous hemagglutinin family protein
MGRQRKAWYRCLLVTVVAVSPAASIADVTTDGSLGPRKQLGGPNFAFPATLGQRSSSNLVRSFDVFDIRHGESVTFSGPGGITNVISRVTGESRSDIDGRSRYSGDSDSTFSSNAGLVSKLKKA